MSDERKHRNRISAQASRDRRKAQLLHLERQVTELEETNGRLRAGLAEATLQLDYLTKSSAAEGRSTGLTQLAPQPNIFILPTSEAPGSGQTTTLPTVRVMLRCIMVNAPLESESGPTTRKRNSTEGEIDERMPKRLRIQSSAKALSISPLSNPLIEQIGSPPTPLVMKKTSEPKIQIQMGWKGGERDAGGVEGGLPDTTELEFSSGVSGQDVLRRRVSVEGAPARERVEDEEGVDVPKIGCGTGATPAPPSSSSTGSTRSEQAYASITRSGEHFIDPNEPDDDDEDLSNSKLSSGSYTTAYVDQTTGCESSHLLPLTLVLTGFHNTLLPFYLVL
ncbi:hypothetical protein B0H14DRAFT_3872142 [Mycena olivaceomarginata]|nr:hypothetical protein B0H14DRAFT_3872142 [Mycena olivaceomarginata]